MTKEEYLKRLGLVTEKDRVRHEHLAYALETLAQGNFNNKSHNRFTGERETLASVIATHIGRDKGYVNKEMAVWLMRFRDAYNPKDVTFTRVCPQKMVEIITPWQLLYLISLEYAKLK